MNESSFRSKPVWKRARQLALALSLILDTFPQNNRTEVLVKTIRKAFVDLLVWIPRASESGFYHGQAESCLKRLADAVAEAREQRLLKAPMTSNILRQLKAVSSALADIRPGGVDSGSGSTEPRMFNSFQTGVFS